MLMVELHYRLEAIDKKIVSKGQMMSDKYDILLHEIKELKGNLQDAEYEKEDLQDEIRVLEEDVIDDNHVLVNIAKQLEIIVVPNMPQWVLLLEIERSIEKMKEK